MGKYKLGLGEVQPGGESLPDSEANPKESRIKRWLELSPRATGSSHASAVIWTL